jgi:hypothetical protein
MPYSKTRSYTDERHPFAARLKWFNHKKAFGFATLEDTQEDVFLHISAIPPQERIPELFHPDAPIVLDYITNSRGTRVSTAHFVEFDTLAFSSNQPSAGNTVKDNQGNRHTVSQPPLTPDSEHYQSPPRL